MKESTVKMGAGPAAGNGQKPAGKVRLMTLDDLDGRTRAAQCVRDTRASVIADLGGEDQLSTLERMAAEHVSLTAAMIADAGTRWLCGEQVDPATVATLTNTFNRTAAALGWQRRAKDVTPDLGSYLKAKLEKAA